MPRVAVIILVWNGMKFLKELLFSLQRMQQPAGGVSFLFVDNASTEGSAEYVRAHFPEAIIIENKENKGFAGGNNVGLEHPAAQAAEYVALLNQDTVVVENWLTELVAALDARADAASAQSLLLYEQERDKINSAGNEIHFLGFGFSRHNGKSVSVISTEAQRSGEISPSFEEGSLGAARDAEFFSYSLLSQEKFVNLDKQLKKPHFYAA